MLSPIADAESFELCLPPADAKRIIRRFHLESAKRRDYRRRTFRRRGVRRGLKTGAPRRRYAPANATAALTLKNFELVDDKSPGSRST
ncbi:MAG: hypothetical protein ACLRSW_01415 [Christensenellaceae bacterium]